MPVRPTFVAAAAGLTLPLVAISGTGAGAQPADRGGPLLVTTVLSGKNLDHTFTTAGGSTATEALAGPDDLTAMAGELFTVFQNGVGPQGEPSATGNTASTVVAFTPTGHPIAQWDIAGHADGLTADPGHHRLIATVNEDANSSLFTIDPATGAVQHYRYNLDPLPHNGGTDAVTVYHGQILITASAPGTATASNPNPPAAPQAGYPAVYVVSVDPATSVATVKPLFSDEATATAANGANQGQSVTLGLTDPDSNEKVPHTSPRFAGDFVLDSQGDQQQIYVSHPGGAHQTLSVLTLDQSVNDTAWATEETGTLYATDDRADQVDAITGPFTPGTAFVAVTPCDANSAPANCAPNYVGVLDLTTGHVTATPTSAPVAPNGLMFVSDHHPRGRQGDRHDG